ncbi:MAG: type II toxin-antitoxin system VapC family toxin [Candidatus Thorarchaeota archaeon]
MPVTIVIDTNFLTVPAQFGIDIFSEAERIIDRRLDFVTLTTAVAELDNKLAEAPTIPEKRKFSIARDLISRCEVIDVGDTLSGLPVDDQLLEYTASVKGVLATNDKDLRNRAKKRGVPLLLMRGKKRIVLDGVVF